jgi:anaerobic dimethyl sulfoxide reductase subunit C (anchor subunit)
MFAEEWPLMMFTLISQLAIGSYIILAFVRTLVSRQDNSEARQLTNPGFKAVGALMILALIFSLFHLGTPTGAYRSILNLGSSWLSREILTAGAFLVFWFLSYQAYKKDSASSGVISIVTMVIGLAAIYSMANIYSHSIRPAWTNVNTYVAFFGATFALGSLGAAALVVYGAKGRQLSSAILGSLKKVNVIAALAVILPLVYLPVYISGLAGGNAAAQASAQILTGSYLVPLIIRALLSLGGVGVLFYAFKAGRNALPKNWVYLALVLVMIGEFMGRYVFYGSGISIMIGLN